MPSPTTLLCFPYAGGRAGSYGPWRALAPDWLEIVDVELPGHGRRLSERPRQDLVSLVRLLGGELASYWTSELALFGHSMGALVAFELARAMRREGRGEPLALFVSGAPAPHLPPCGPPCHEADDQELKRRLVDLNGTPREVLDDPSMARLVLPIVRADFRVLETYRWTSEAPLSCPIVAFGGVDDPVAPADAVAEWSRHTSAETAVRIMPGGHFFVHDHSRSIIETIRCAIARARVETARTA